MGAFGTAFAQMNGVVVAAQFVDGKAAVFFDFLDAPHRGAHIAFDDFELLGRFVHAPLQFFHQQ